MCKRNFPFNEIFYEGWTQLCSQPPLPNSQNLQILALYVCLAVVSGGFKQSKIVCLDRCSKTCCKKVGRVLSLYVVSFKSLHTHDAGRHTYAKLQRICCWMKLMLYILSQKEVTKIALKSCSFYLWKQNKGRFFRPCIFLMVLFFLIFYLSLWEKSLFHCVFPYR